MKIKILKKLFISFNLLIIPFALFSQSNDNQLSLSRDFELGNKYRILQYRANVRTEPNRDATVIAILSLDDEVEIVENVWNAEVINEVWGCWYKIKYGDLVGYTFGGNIAMGSVVNKIGNNKISVHFRITNVSGGNPWPVEGWLYPYVNQRTGIFVYVNEQRYYSNSVLFQYEMDYTNDRIYPTLYSAQWLDLEDIDGQPLIKLHSYGRRGARFTTVYKINESGDAEFLEYDEEGNKYTVDENRNTWAKWNEWWNTEWWHKKYRIIDNTVINGELWIRHERR